MSEPNCVQPPERPESARALGWALGLTVLIAVVEGVGGFVAHSLALLADAGHMVTDAGALTLSLFALWISRRPPTAEKTFGYYRLEILAALFNGALLIAITVWIVVAALGRLHQPQPIRSGLMLAVAALGLAANLWAVRMLHRARHENLNTQAAYLHILGDTLGSVGAIAAAGIILLTGWLQADALISMGIGALILVSAVRLVSESVDILLEAAPRHVSLPDLQTAIGAVPGVTDVHDLHVWTVSNGIVAMSGHATVPDPAGQQVALEEICRRVRAFGIQHVTVQLERERVWHS
ncbi:MAG: cation diffusion facilitator family transporter [Gemmatimonadales bacterium]